MCTINDNHMMYGYREMEHDSWTVVIWTSFSSFTPLTTQKIKMLKNWKKKTPGGIVILHKCTINDNHKMYASWDMKHDREFLVILGHFLPFYPPNNPKNLNFEKMKKTLEISSFYKSVPKIMIIFYTAPEIWMWWM